MKLLAAFAVLTVAQPVLAGEGFLDRALPVAERMAQALIDGDGIEHGLALIAPDVLSAAARDQGMTAEAWKNEARANYGLAMRDLRVSAAAPHAQTARFGRAGRHDWALIPMAQSVEIISTGARLDICRQFLFFTDGAHIYALPLPDAGAQAAHLRAYPEFAQIPLDTPPDCGPSGQS